MATDFKSGYVGYVIEKRTALLVLALFFLARPAFVYYQCGRIVQLIMLGGWGVTGVVIFLIWLKNRRVSKVFLLCTALYGVIILSTICNGGSIIDAARNYASYFFIIMLVENEIDNIEELWKACVVYLTIVLTINLITILLFPNGMFWTATSRQDYWFFIDRNGLGPYTIPLLFCKADLDNRRYSMLRPSFYVISMICIVSTVLVRSSTSVVTTLLMFILLVASNAIKLMKPKVFSIYLFIGIVGLFFVIFVILQNTQLFSYFIESVLKETLTFSGRTRIWKVVIDSIAKSPVLGNGYLTNEEFTTFLGGARNAHNYLLEMGMYGGIIAMALFIYIIIMIARIIRTKQFDFTGIALTAFLFAFLFEIMFESRIEKLFWMVLTYAFYVKEREGAKAADYKNDLLGWSMYV